MIRLRPAALLLAFACVAALASAASAAPSPSVDDFLRSLNDPPAMSTSSGSGATVTFSGNTCTITQQCGWAPQVSCTGISCHSTSKTCPNGGSSCPAQGGQTVAGVQCKTDSGGVVEFCPCPEICYGCGAPCTFESDCDAVCSCGAGGCENGSCFCIF